MPIGPSKILVNNWGVSGDSPDYLDAGDANSVILEAWPVQSGTATVTLIDSADETTGFFPGVSPASVQAGLTARTKVQIDNVLRFVRIRMAIAAGQWNVRVTPINSNGATTVQASVSGLVSQGAAGSDSASGWWVRVSDGWGTMPNGASSAYGVYVRPSYRGASSSDRAESPAPGQAAVLTVPPIVNRRHVICGVAWGCSDTPPAGTLLEVWDGTVGQANNLRHRFPITAAGPGAIVWSDEGYSVNTALTVQLSALGGSLMGYVDALGRHSEP